VCSSDLSTPRKGKREKDNWMDLLERYSASLMHNSYIVQIHTIKEI